MRTPEIRAAYRHFRRMDTRWNDNDAYGHINNVVYYAFFDTAVNAHLIQSGCLDIQKSPVIGLVVETQCQYFKPIAYPDVVHAGIRVARLGTSSVRYDIGLFANDDEAAAAQGHFVHVYTERATGRPAPIPDDVRSVLGKLMLPA
ncbi:MAG: acyl-CoA thioesterase [Myxococcota bacterium]|nr:acyl-CoA thioesterase [Myxococcota bacterium]PWB65996.1 MAG: thioesterase [Bradyrhizobiaceae bacterium]